MRILRAGIRHLGRLSSISGLKKSDARKAQLVNLLRTQTSMSNNWIAVKLSMGHPGLAVVISSTAWALNPAV